MKRNKWQYTTVHRTIQGLDFNELKTAMLEYEEGELLLRKKINWDVAQMRKFFHGPVRAFIEELERKRGSSKGKEEIKADLKEIYGPREKRTLGGKEFTFLKSTGDYDFDEYLKFLCDIDAFCMENYECGLPPAEQVE